MSRTYTQCIQNGVIVLPHMATAMFHLMAFDRPEHDLAWMSKQSRVDRGALSAALSQAAKRGFVDRERRGIYKPTRKGLKAWGKIFDERLLQQSTPIPRNKK